MGEKIFVTGATGNIGSFLTKTLKERGADVIAGISARRDPKQFEPYGIKASVIDFGDPGSMMKAMENVDRIFLLVPLTRMMPQWALHALNAAKEADVKFVLRSSALGADSDSSYSLQEAHGLIDNAVKDSELPYAIIRPNTFMQNFSTYYAASIKDGHAIVFPQGEGRVSFIDVRDVASAAAEILLNPDTHKYKTYNVTGGEVLSNHEAAEALTRVLGEEIRYQPVDPGIAEEAMKQMGLSEWTVDIMMSLNNFIKDGKAVDVTDAINDITGKDPISFEQFVNDYKKTWT